MTKSPDVELSTTVMAVFRRYYDIGVDQIA